MKMVIEFSKAWGQDENRWNYPGGDYNFRTMTLLMEFYGIKEARIIGTETYFEGEKETPCNTFLGFATKEIERIKKHWLVEYCNPCKHIATISYN